MLEISSDCKIYIFLALWGAKNEQEGILLKSLRPFLKPSFQVRPHWQEKKKKSAQFFHQAIPSSLREGPLILCLSSKGRSTTYLIQHLCRVLNKRSQLYHSAKYFFLLFRYFYIPVVFVAQCFSALCSCKSITFAIIRMVPGAVIVGVRRMLLVVVVRSLHFSIIL